MVIACMAGIRRERERRTGRRKRRFFPFPCEHLPHRLQWLRIEFVFPMMMMMMMMTANENDMFNGKAETICSALVIKVNVGVFEDL